MTNESKNSGAEDSLRRLRLIVTLGALAIALLRLIFPQLTIDAVTLGLLVIAVLPWIAPLIKSLELPGGWKVELREMQQVAAKAQEAGLLESGSNAPKAEHAFQLVADRDPNLALAGLRIEIERRLVALAEKNNVQARWKGVGQLLRELDKLGALTNEQRSALADLTGLLNSAVHGASVDPRASSWALEIGPPLLRSLDRLVDPQGVNIFVQPGAPKSPKEGDLWIY
jgi:hypothetical protein